MSELLSQLAKGGEIVAFGIVMLLTIKALPAVVTAFRNGHATNGNGALGVRVESLEKEVDKLKENDHNKVKPTLRWHDSEIVRLGGERSKSLLP